MEEKLLQLEGKFIALQAVTGILLNEVSPTLEARKHLRDIIGHIMDRVSFSDLAGYSESEKAHLTEGFFRCLNEMADKIVITDHHDESP